jgi:hypothetical protein
MLDNINDTFMEIGNNNGAHLENASPTPSTISGSDSNNNNNGVNEAAERDVNNGNHDRSAGHIDRAVTLYERALISNHSRWAANAMNALGEIAMVIEIIHFTLLTEAHHDGDDITYFVIYGLYADPITH